MEYFKKEIKDIFVRYLDKSFMLFVKRMLILFAVMILMNKIFVFLILLFL